MNVSIGTIAGAGIGVAIGYYGFKTKKILPLVAFGVGGAIASGYVTNMLTPKPKPIADVTPQIEADVETTEYVENDGDVMEFNEQLGYMLPKPDAEVEPTSPNSEMELSFQ